MIASAAIALAGAACAAMLAAGRPVTLDAKPTARAYASAVEAVEAALGDMSGGVVAFGELHQTNATAGVPSSLRRFTADVLPRIAGRLSHLVVETWVTTGRCGEAERAVTADVERTTERPAATESEIETLIRSAHERGVSPRILSISCADYASMRASDPTGAVDYDRALRVTERALETAILRALVDAAAASGRTDPPSAPRLVGVYGGALHNDLAPDAELASYSFAPRALAATLGRYIEIDLIVPEYAASSAAVRAQPWWRVWRNTRRPGVTVLIRRAARSFVIIFPAQRR